MTYFKKFFLPWFIVFIFIVGLKFLASNTTNKDAIFHALLICFIGALILSLLYYFWETKWDPRVQIQNKMMNKPPLVNFMDLGFIQKDNYMIGEIKGYQVILKCTPLGPGGNPTLSFETLFNPEKHGRLINQEVISGLAKKHRHNKFLWGRNFIYSDWAVNVTPPSFNKVFSQIKLSTEILHSEGLLPQPNNK